MNTRSSIPTDIMCRRTPLPLCRQFSLFGATIVIHTNYESILMAAEKRGFIPLQDAAQRPVMRWEIVGTMVGRPTTTWPCNVALTDHSLYLSMGPEQWFAFDLKTCDAAGFVLIHDSDSECDTNAERYLTAVALNLGVSMRTDLEQSSCD